MIGIDPGLTRLGYGVVEKVRGGIRCHARGILTTSPDDDRARRLLELSENLEELLDLWRCDEMAIERVLYNRNAQTAVPVIQASGVALLAAAAKGLPAYEYTPLEVKQSVVGTGTATKSQVAFMVARLLGAATDPRFPDAADALAVAVCHLHGRTLRAAAGAVR